MPASPSRESFSAFSAGRECESCSPLAPDFPLLLQPENPTIRARERRTLLITTAQTCLTDAKG